MSFYKLARGVVYGFFKLFFRIEVIGTENIPSDEGFIVCANHISYLDPPLLGSCLPFRLTYMAKEELFKNKIFGKLISALGAFPVRRGAGDLGALRTAVKQLKRGSNTVIFPEGGRSDGKYLRKGKSGAVLIASMANVGILPIGIVGKYRLFGKVKVNIGKMIYVNHEDGKKADSDEIKSLTASVLMPAISELSGVQTYENRNS